MADTTDDTLLNALSRLNRALEGLGKAVDQAASSSTLGRDADEVAHIMSQDRAALARDLDASEARAKQLSEVNSEVSRRLLGAMETVRSVLERQNA